MIAYIPWKRFWCTPDGKIQIEPTGFLVDPEDEYGKFMNPDVVGFDQMDSYPCLILLGEPGIGKTYALRYERERLEKAYAGGEDILQLVQLKDYGSEDRLYREVFESEWWRSWKGGSNRLTLFFDGLDEGLLRISNLSRVIMQGVKTGAPERLSVRIACRTADWPSSFQENLKEFLGEERVKAYELAPLREKDVVETARAAGLDPDRFLAEVEVKSVGPFAAKPVTLRFLLSLYAKGGTLSDTQTDLYERGCLHLCEEPDEDRRRAGERDPRFQGNLPPRQRLAVASRIAAVTLLGNRSAIFVGDELLGVPDDDAGLSTLTGGSEKTEQGMFSVDERAVREVLKTALFTSRGPDRLGWAHQTYAEYLAARYLGSAPLEQVRSLLGQSDEGGEYVIPQLSDTAAWLAGMRSDVFSWIVSIEPEVLLRGDVSKTDYKIKEDLVSALLKGFLEGNLLDTRELGANFHKLAYPGLHAKLKPIIRNKALGFIPRRAAIDIAEACRQRSLQNLLADVALDQTEEHKSRTQAAYAVWKIGDEDTKKRLAPLARGDAGEDPDDDLRGIGLRCLWPKHMSVAELLSCLTPPKEDSYFGSYEYFLRGELIRDMKDEDLPEFLAAATGWPSRTTYSDSRRDLEKQITKRAWDAMDVPGVKAALARLFATRINDRNYSEWGSDDAELSQELRSNPQKRWALLEEILNNTDILPDHCYRFLAKPFALEGEEDTLWLLEKIEQAPPDCQPAWARCIGSMPPRTGSSAVVDRILDVRTRVPALAKEFEWLDAWDLESERAKKAKQNYLESLQWQQPRKPESLDPTPDERVRQDLDKFEGGDPEGWIQLALDLTLEPTDTHYKPYIVDLREAPGWQAADPKIQERILAATKAYILNHAPGSNSWLGTNQIPWFVHAGYRAFFLMIDDQEFLQTIPTPVWQRWTPTLVGYPGYGEKSHKRLTSLAYRNAPDQVLSCLEVLIDRMNEQNGAILSLSQFEDCWDDPFSLFAVERLKRGDLNIRNTFVLCDYLFSHGTQKACEQCADFLVNELRQGWLVAVSLELLLTHNASAAWPAIWPYFKHQPDLASVVLEKVAQDRHRGSARLIEPLRETEIGDLYLWLSKRFPPDTDPKHEGVYQVGPRENLAEFRNDLLRELISRGTREACQVIERLVKELPDQHPWLVWRLREAQDNARRRTWRPPRADDIITLLGREDRRHIDSEAQLLAVVKESLDRLQDRLQGELPAVGRLWNYEGGGGRRSNFRPKDEEDLSDEIARWLKDDLGPARGIVVNREVQPRRGQKTDIYISAMTPGAAESDWNTLKVVIEVKGCWNDELSTAMKTQLVDRYLIENGLSHGLFVVGWYVCDKWSDDDSRKTRAQNLSLDDLREGLASQAKGISQENPSIRIQPYILDLALK